jgi:hypothetical protein
LGGCSGVIAGAGEAAQVAGSNSGAQLVTVQPTPAGMPATSGAAASVVARVWTAATCWPAVAAASARPATT